MSYVIILFLASSFLVWFHQSAIANTNESLLKSKLFLLKYDIDQIPLNELSEADKQSLVNIRDIIKCYSIFLSEIGIHQAYVAYKERKYQTETFKQAKQMTSRLSDITDSRLRQIYFRAAFYISVSAFSSSFVTLMVLSPLVIIAMLLAALKWQITSIGTAENTFYLRKKKRVC